MCCTCFEANYNCLFYSTAWPYSLLYINVLSLMLLITDAEWTFANDLLACQLLLGHGELCRSRAMLLPYFAHLQHSSLLRRLQFRRHRVTFHALWVCCKSNSFFLILLIAQWFCWSNNFVWVRVFRKNLMATALQNRPSAKWNCCTTLFLRSRHRPIIFCDLSILSRTFCLSKRPAWKRVK